MKKVEFLLYPGMLALDITGPLEVFNTATLLLHNLGKMNSGYTFIFTSQEIGPVKTSSGLSMVADSTFNSRHSPDIFLIPGGKLSENEIKTSNLINYVKSQKKKDIKIVSVCKGAFILAEAGLLDGKRVTTHWMSADSMRKNYPDINVDIDAIYIQDENIYTSAGVTSGIDLALALVEQDYGRPMALEVSRYLVLYYKRPGFQSQYSSPLMNQTSAGDKFNRLITWLEKNLLRNVTVEEMAEYSAMSPRNFARVFKKETGQGPNKFFENMKLDRARELLISGCNSLDEVAEKSGFGREERLRRAFLRRYGLTPSQFKLHFSN